MRAESVAHDAQLHDARLKVARAEKHLLELQQEIRTFLSTEPYVVSTRQESGKQIATVTMRVAPPALLSAIVADCVYNLRTSLELVFWRLALLTGPKDPNRDRITFPIFASDLKFRAASQGIGNWVPTTALPVIEGVQPFRTRNPSLTILRQLADEDRHGFIRLTVGGCGRAGQTTACVALAHVGIPTIGADTLVREILRHLNTDVLPKFDSFFAMQTT